MLGLWICGRHLEQRLQPLLSGRLAEVEHLIGTELHGNGLNIARHSLFFGDIQIPCQHVDGRSDQHGDDAEHQHDFKEGVS